MQHSTRFLAEFTGGAPTTYIVWALYMHSLFSLVHLVGKPLVVYMTGI